MRVCELTTRYLKDLKRRGRAENTIKFYGGRLVAFDRWFGKRKLRSITKREIRKYLKTVNRWPDKTPMAPDTQRANIAAFEQVQAFAIRRGWLKKPILDQIDKPAGRNREMLPTPDEVAQIKSISSKEFCWIYEALRRSGARPNEMARATVENWDRETSEIVLMKHKTSRKTGKPRRISVGAVLEAIFLESLGDRTTGPIFLKPMGNPWDPNSMSAAFRRARNELGLHKEIVLYTSRHEHGTAMYNMYGELKAAKSLGHEGLGMITRYVKIKPEIRREAQDSLEMSPTETKEGQEIEQQRNASASQEAANTADLAGACSLG